MLARMLILAVLASAGVAVAVARPAGNANNVHLVCRADYDRYCPPYEGHRRGLAECIRDHLGEASPVCQEAVHDYMRQLRAAAARDPRVRRAAQAELGLFGDAP